MDNYFFMPTSDIKINDFILIEGFSFSFDKNICLLGESGSGKSTFIKQLKNGDLQYQTNGKVSFYMGEEMSQPSYQELFSHEKLDEDTNSFLEKFFQNHKNLHQKMALVQKIFTHPNYLFLEQVSFSFSDWNLLLSYLNKKHIFLFYVTNDIETTVLFDYLIVLKNHQVAVEGSMTAVLKEEKIMKVLGYSLPFYVNLSIQLSYYGLLDKICYNKTELEENLWP